MGYYNQYLYENAITWTTDGANAGTVHYRDGKFYCTNVCGVLLNEDGNANRCIAEILGSISKKYVSYVGNPKLMNNVMSEIRIHVPSVSEQKKIDEFISALDLRITKQRDLIEHLKKYKRGVYKNIFATSRLDCTWVSLGELCEIITKGTTPHSFLSNIGNRCWSKRSAYEQFRRILTRAQIPHTAEGPRLHDFRHTFSVHTLAEMSSQGLDLYYSLPILSKYLGHTSLEATDHYVRLTAEMYPELLQQANQLCSYVFPEVSYDGV